MDLLVTYGVTILLILCLLGGWIGVQHLARAFAARHPELGPAREEGGGCGGLLCFCKNGQDCPKDKLKKAFSRTRGH